MRVTLEMHLIWQGAETAGAQGARKSPPPKGVASPKGGLTAPPSNLRWAPKCGSTASLPKSSYQR